MKKRPPPPLEERERSNFFYYSDLTGRACVRVQLPGDGTVLVQHKAPNRHWKGGWPEGLTLPYRARDLVAASEDETIYVVDDERSAEALVAGKRTATVIRFPTADADPADDWLQAFKGKRVLVIPDRSAEATLRTARLLGLLQGVAKWILDVELDGLDLGEGLGDWLARHNGDLVELDDYVYRHFDAREKAKLRTVTVGTGGRAPAGGDGAELAEADDGEDLAEGFVPLPLDALPPILGRWVEAAAAALSCDPALLALPALVSCAGAIGNTRVCQILESWLEPCILWAIAIAPPSSRKTAAFKQAKGPLEAVDLELARQAADDLAAYQDELDRWEGGNRRGRGMDQPDPTNPKPKKPEPRKLLIGDITVETAVREMRRQPRGLTLLRDELSGWLGSFGRYSASGAGQSEVSCWTECYEGGAYRYDRSSGDGISIVVPRCSISVYGTIQPEVMKRCFPESLFESGFAYRFMLAAPPRKSCRWSENTIPKEIAEDYAALVRALTDLDRHDVVLPTWRPRPVPFSQDAYRGWIKFHDDMETNIDASQGQRQRLLGKGKALCPRLALVLHTIEQLIEPQTGEAITARTMERATRLALWSVQETERVYGLIHADAAQLSQARLLEWLRQRPGPITARDLCLSNKTAYKSVKVAALALEALVSQGIGSWRDRPTTAKGGRPTVEFVLSRP